MNGRLLVTGSNGFLGSEIVHQAIVSGIQVRATDRNTGPSLPGVEYQSADILDYDNLVPAFFNIDAVIHTAGLAHVFDQAKQDPARFFAVNEQGTANVAMAAREAGVRHLLVISSVSVYGDGTLGATEDAICRPKGLYAESKLLAEQRAQAIAKNGDMQLTILRLATLYGEGDPGNVARLMRAIDRRRFIWIGDGSNQKSLLYRGDAVRACLTALQYRTDGVGIFNVAAAPVTMFDVITGLSTALGRTVPRLRIPAVLAVGISTLAANFFGKRGRFGTLENTLKKWLADDVYDGSKFRDKLGFETTVDLEEGLHRQVAWYRGIGAAR